MLSSFRNHFKKGLRTVIKLRNVNVIFNQGKSTIHAVKDVDLTVEKKDVYGIVGYSGAGKSTLVRVINLLQCVEFREAAKSDKGLAAIGITAALLVKTALDVICNPELLHKIKAEHKERVEKQ